MEGFSSRRSNLLCSPPTGHLTGARPSSEPALAGSSKALSNAGGARSFPLGSPGPAGPALQRPGPESPRTGPRGNPRPGRIHIRIPGGAGGRGKPNPAPREGPAPFPARPALTFINFWPTPEVTLWVHVIDGNEVVLRPARKSFPFRLLLLLAASPCVGLTTEMRGNRAAQR